MKFGSTTRIFIMAVCVSAVAATARAQGRGGGGPPPGGGGGGGGGGMGGGMGGPQFPGGGQGGGGQRPGGPGPGQGPQPGQPQPPGQRGPGGVNGPGLQLGPPGRWWDDANFVKSLKLRPEQQTRMDAIFEENRSTLVSHLQGLKQAQEQMLDLSRSPTPDEAALLAQIDRVAQARAELQKADTRMLLEIRKEMDADQIKRLDKTR